MSTAAVTTTPSISSGMRSQPVRVSVPSIEIAASSHGGSARSHRRTRYSASVRFGPSMFRSYSRRMSRPSTPSTLAKPPQYHRHPTHRQRRVPQQHTLDVGIGPRRAASHADHDREVRPSCGISAGEPSPRPACSSARRCPAACSAYDCRTSAGPRTAGPGLQRHLTDFHNIAAGALLAASKHQEEQGDQHRRAPDQGGDR